MDSVKVVADAEAEEMTKKKNATSVDVGNKLFGRLRS